MDSLKSFQGLLERAQDRCRQQECWNEEHSTALGGECLDAHAGMVKDVVSAIEKLKEERRSELEQ